MTTAKSQETTITILAAVGVVLVIIVIIAIYYKIRHHQVYELYQNDNVLAVRRKSIVASIMPENGDGVAGGFTSSQLRHQAEKDRANDFRLRAKTVSMHKDSVNHKAVLRLSQKKAANGEVTLEDNGEAALDAIPLETTTTVANADIETGNV